jgi:hypothetical protein
LIVLITPVYYSEVFPAQWFPLTFFLIVLVVTAPAKEPFFLIELSVLLQILLLKAVLIFGEDFFFAEEKGPAEDLEVFDFLSQKVLQTQPLVIIFERNTRRNESHEN